VKVKPPKVSVCPAVNAAKEELAVSVTAATAVTAFVAVAAADCVTVTEVVEALPFTVTELCVIEAALPSVAAAVVEDAAVWVTDTEVPPLTVMAPSVTAVSAL
jgi:hypothetical protein